MKIKFEMELEVPEGAEVLVQHRDNGELVWFKDDFNLMISERSKGHWDDSNFSTDIVDKLDYMMSKYNSVVLWEKKI